MFLKLFPSTNKIIQKIKKHPQLFWTIFVSISIIIGFVVMYQIFIGIAKDAQERLINARIESIQDSIPEFVVLRDESKEKIDIAISIIIIQNPTTVDFTFYIKENDSFKVFTSSDKSKINFELQNLPVVAQLTINDSKNSYTEEKQNINGRYFQTYRSLTQDEKVTGLIEITQTLSKEDLIIEQNINKAMVIFILILFIVMYLFFKHSKIIDYISLYEELRKAEKLKDDFILIASNEIKKPIEIIRGYVEFIKENENTSEEYKEYSDKIDISSKQLMELIEDMIDVSKIQQGEIQNKIKKILIPDFVKDTVSDFEKIAKEKSLNIKYEVEGLKYPYIFADYKNLQKIMKHLIENSIKYTKEGGIRITVSNIENNLEIKIIDTGIGMSIEESKRLFEKFYRVKNEHTKYIKGTGLGLWIVKELVENMGGTISVESIKGVGTHVIINFKGMV